MTNTAIATILLAGSLLTAACGSPKPSEERCRLAVDNIRAVNRLEKADVGAKPDTMVRSCRANSTREAVECMISAKTVEDLQKCEGEVGAKFYDRAAEREAKEKNQDSDTANKDPS
jgi:hypothetical protein